MRRKDLWIRIGVLSVVFILAVIVSSLITNRGADDMTADMGEATLPRVKFMMGEYEINTLVGYLDEMDITAMRDTITPVNAENKLQMVLEHNDNEIDRIVYEVYSLDGKEVYKRGSAREISGLVEIPLEEKLQDEAVLKVTLSIGERDVNYFTRIVDPEGLDAGECLAFAEKFHANTFEKGAAGELNRYLESNEDGDNTTYQLVTIHSDTNHVMWGELNPEVISNVEWDIKESNYTYTSVLARYRVACVEEDTREIYNVREFFRVRKYKDQIFLLNYQRTMNQVFDGTAQVLGETGIQLGMAPLDVAYATNKDGTIVSFVQERDLWTYNQKGDELSLVFSFSNTEQDDIRNWYDQHQIRILGMDENGSTTFAVYGYMNRGKHEGRVGIDIFYFDIEKNTVEEKAFIPSNKSFVIAEDELGRMVYYSKKSGFLYVLTGGTLYEVNLSSNRQKKLAENLEDGQYVASEDGHLLAYQTQGALNEATEIKVINLKAGKEYTVTCGEGECIRPLGFVYNDFVYGLAKTGDMGETVSGQKILPMYQLEIRDSKNEVVKTYQAKDVYISDVIVEDNMVTVNRVTRKNNIYVGTTQDYITSEGENCVFV